MTGYDIDEAEPGFPGDDLDIGPWPEPVEGVELLDRLVETFKTYLSLDEGAAEVLALWSVYTYAIDACQFAPRLFLKSPVPRCGKTTALGTSVMSHDGLALPAISRRQPCSGWRTRFSQPC